MSRSDVPAPQTVRENPILKTKIWNKMHVHNDNWMAACVGETGSGKTYTALRIAETVDPGFSIDQVAFSVEEFLRLVLDESLGRGSIIVFEEASVEAAAGDWHSKSNKVLRNVLDTWRHQNRGAIFTLPAFGQLDKGARGRMSALIQQVQVREDEGFSIAKYKWCDQDSDTGKIYKKYPRLDGKVFKRLKVRKPSEDLVEAYEKRKSEYTRKLNEGLLEELLDAKRDPDEERPDPADIADEIISENRVGEFIDGANGQRWIDKEAISLEFGVGQGMAKTIKKALQRSGEVDEDVM